MKFPCHRCAHRSEKQAKTACRRGQHGAILMEGAIVFPLLAMIFLTLADVFFYTNAYMATNQMVREGIMTGAALSTISPDNGSTVVITLLSGAPVNDCAPDGTSNCGHYRVQWRMQQLRDALPLNFTTFETVETAYSDATLIFRVKIAGTYHGTSPFFYNRTFFVEARGVSKAL